MQTDFISSPYVHTCHLYIILDTASYKTKPEGCTCSFGILDQSRLSILGPPGVLGIWGECYFFSGSWGANSFFWGSREPCQKVKTKFIKSHLKGKASILFDFFKKFFGFWGAAPQTPIIKCTYLQDHLFLKKRKICRIIFVFVPPMNVGGAHLFLARSSFCLSVYCHGHSNFVILIGFLPNFIHGLLLSNSLSSLNTGFVRQTIIKMAGKMATAYRYLVSWPH